MGLADHGIAADATEFLGDLAGGCAAFPHLRQLLDPLFGPAHARANPSYKTLRDPRFRHRRPIVFSNAGTPPRQLCHAVAASPCQRQAGAIPHLPWQIKSRPAQGATTGITAAFRNLGNRFSAVSTGWDCGPSI
jgi:hypothetical protein